MLTEAALIPLLEPFFDQQSPRFTSFPATQNEAAARWARAAAAWAQNVTPLSTAAGTAEQAFQQVLAAALPQGRRSALSEAWGALAIALAAGMAPGWVATPPPVPLDLEPVFFIGEHGGSNRECLEALAHVVSLWMHTGLAVQAGTSLTVTWN